MEQSLPLRPRNPTSPLPAYPGVMLLATWQSAPSLPLHLGKRTLPLIHIIIHVPGVLGSIIALPACLDTSHIPARCAFSSH